MRKIFRFPLLLLLCLLTALPTEALAQRKPHMPPNKSKQLPKISGVVIASDDKLPLAGATVRVLNTDFGTTTDINGRFEFKDFSLTNATLQISYIGMKTKTVKASSNMRIVLDPNVKGLEGVVVTGIFKKAKESYTGSVSTISKEDLKTFKGQNLIQTLKNIDASLNIPINNTWGSDPNRLPEINIRGQASLPDIDINGGTSQADVNTPLIIMDGFEIPLRKLLDFNEEEIESINILKDASATAIYGSRGANGVIVIITKAPAAGKLKLTLVAGGSLEIPDLSSYSLLNARENLELEKAAGLYTDKNSPSQQLLLDKYYDERLRNVLAGTDIDWVSKPLRNGFGHRYNIRLEGGSQEFRWSAGVDYNQIKGAMKGSERNSFSGDITLTYMVKKLIFRNKTSIGTNSSSESKYGFFQSYTNQKPYNNPYNEHGELVPSFQNLTHTNLKGNPLYDARLNIFDTSKGMNVSNNFSIDWVIYKDLRLVSRIGISHYTRNTDDFTPPGHSQFLGESYQTAEGSLGKGRYTMGMSRSFNVDANSTLSYSALFANKHQIYGGMDFSISEGHDESVGIVAEGFSNEELSDIGNALRYQKNSAPSGFKSISRRVGYTANVTYTYDNRYFADASYRTDGSSQFGANKRFAPFWSAGIGWNVNNEPWLYGNQVLNTLRFRGSVGQTGSLDFRRSSVITTYAYQSGRSYLNWPAARLSGWGNPDLTWQKTNMINGAIEFGFFKNRISGRLEGYVKETSALTSQMDLPPAKGFRTYNANIGSIRNKGAELYMSSYLIRNSEKKLNWRVGIQLMYNKSLIQKLSDGIKEQMKIIKQTAKEVVNIYEEGRPIRSVYAVRSLGIDPSTGDEIFLDRYGNMTETYSPSEKVFLGDGTPTFRGNLNTSLIWKGLTLNISGSYHWGGKIVNSTLQNRVEVTRGQIGENNVDSRVLYARWLQPGDRVFFKNFENSTATQPTSRFVMDDATFQIQSMSLQYRLEGKQIPWIKGIRSLTMGLNMSNIAHFSTVKQERGIGYPFARNVMGSLTLMF